MSFFESFRNATSAAALAKTAAALALTGAAALVALSSTHAATAQAPAQAGIRRFVPPPRFTSQPAPRGPRLFQLAQGATCSNPPETVAGNTIKLDLHLAYVNAVLNNPSIPGNPTESLRLRSYSGCLTSPQIDAEPGDSLRITLYNDLPTNDPTCGQTPAPNLAQPAACFNTTNLHTHGLHVDPGNNSDNVLLSISPGTSFKYKIDIPKDHPAGTFWYHAHMHGSTAVHVASADAGVLVIHGHRKYPSPLADIDTILHEKPGISGLPKNFTDTTFVLQQIPYACFTDATYQNLITTQGLFNATNANNTPPPTPAPGQSPIPYPPAAPWSCVRQPKVYPSMTAGVVENFGLQMFSSTIWDTNGRFTSINGQVQPTIEVPAGAIQRWRFVHAGIHDTINLQIVKAASAAAAGTVPRLYADLAGKSRQAQAPIVAADCPTQPTPQNPRPLIPQLEIAVDGLTRTKIHTIDPLGVQPLAIATSPPIYPSNYLQPGYRSDVLVAFPADGWYCLIDQTAPPSERVNPATLAGGGNGPSVAQLLAVVHVVGGKPITKADIKRYITSTIAGANHDLPSSIRTALVKHDDISSWAAMAPYRFGLPKPPPHPEPYAHFQISNSVGFSVNGQSYDPTTVSPVLIRKVGTTDDWEVEVSPQPTVAPSPAGSPGQFPLDLGEPHIFHIHINPFEIVDVKRRYYDSNGKLTAVKSIYDANGNCIPSIVSGDTQHLADQYCGLWHVFRDTLFIENSFEVTLRTQYVRYTGEFVLHCHILDHEDAGMMANVQIVQDPNHPPKPAKPGMVMRH
jgi:FtsP/CotA-like multicopper oxidase with cupredoxin domain